MTSLRYIILLAALSGAAWAAKPAPCDVYLKNKDAPEPGYLVSADAKGLFFSVNDSGANARLFPHNLVDRVAFKEPLAWREGQRFWLKGEYAKAEREFAKIVDDYGQLESVPGNYSAPARLRQLDSLRKLGNYKAVGEKRFALRKEGAGSNLAVLNDIYQGWAYMTNIKAAGAAENLDRLIQPHRGKSMDVNLMIQIAFLSGVAHDRLGRPAQALNDYHRAFTLDFGSDKELSKMAMEAALQVYAADPKLDEKYPLLREAHGLAAVYAKQFGKVPSGLERFTKALPPPPSDVPTSQEQPSDKGKKGK